MRSLRRARDDRYPTAQALQLDLEAFAREHKLMVSPVALAGYLESLFGARVTEWRQALESGQTLADHLAGQSPNTSADLPDRTATDAFAFGAQPPAITIAKTPKPRPRGITRKYLLAGALALTFGLVAAATTLHRGRDVPTDPVPAHTTVAPMPASQIASRATPANTFARRQSPRAATTTTTPVSPRAGHRSRDVSEAGSASGASNEQGSPALRPTPTPVTNTALPREPGATTTANPAATILTPAAPVAPAAPPALKVWDPDSPVPP